MIHMQRKGILINTTYLLFDILLVYEIMFHV